MSDKNYKNNFVDERITSGDIDKLNELFERLLDIYFDDKGKLKPEVGEEAYRTFEAARHLMLFSRRSLLELADKAGLVPLKLLSNGLDISTLSRMKGLSLSGEIIYKLQKIVDDSLQGDLLRGYFRKK